MYLAPSRSAEGSSNPGKARRAEVVQREAERCERIVQNLLSFARRQEPIEPDLIAAEQFLLDAGDDAPAAGSSEDSPFPPGAATPARVRCTGSSIGSSLSGKVPQCIATITGTTTTGRRS